VSHLRWDPSCAPCEFACDALTVATSRAPRGESVGGVAGLLRRLRRGAAQAAGARPRVSSAIPPDRKERVLATIDRAGVGLEIGPSHDPIAPKRDGFRVEVIDHASREELIAKYGGHPISLERIEEVDYVWHGESYLELTRKPAHYDWIIASHLIEHTPDLIAFLVDCDALLKDSGVLSLVIPDKRYVFDRFRPVTGIARVIDSHLAGAKVHSQGAMAEHHLNAVGKANMLGWYEGLAGSYSFIHNAQQTRDKMREAAGSGAYLDIHNWCFTPHSFRLLIEDLHALGYTRLREVRFHATEGCEFYATLGRSGTGPDLSRMEILKAIDAELAAAEGT
jgi:2-polyprenyl-3-methyl-5-hydroxy-6-metoxy-1,4-benzoquinol methylase